MNRIVFVILLLLLGCSPKHVKTDPAFPGPIIKRDCYEYRAEAKNLWLVWAENTKCMDWAKQEIGCGICASETYGMVRIVELKEEKKK